MATYPQPDPHSNPEINPSEWGEMFAQEIPSQRSKVQPRHPYGDVGFLRIEVADEWSAEGFQELLSNIQEIHDSHTTLQYLGFLIELERENNLRATSEGQRGETNHHWETLYTGGGGISLQLSNNREQVALEPLTNIRGILKPLIIQLNISAIRVESPGWVELVGHLNPLKVIADFITKWRAENTKREKQKMEFQLAKQKADRKYSIDTYRLLPDSPSRRHLGRRMAETSEEIIQPNLRRLNRLANDSKIIKVEVLEEKKQLPPPSGEKAA